MLSVAHAAVVFTPCHFIGIGCEVRLGNVMVCSDFSATKAAKETVGLVCARLAVRIGLAVIDALGQITVTPIARY